MLKCIGVALLVAAIATVGWMMEMAAHAEWGPVIGLAAGIVTFAILQVGSRGEVSDRG